MIRYTLFVMTVLSAATAAVATVTPANSFVASKPSNISIFYKNSDIAAIASPIVVEQCAKEDCSDTPSNS